MRGADERVPPPRGEEQLARPAQPRRDLGRANGRSERDPRPAAGEDEVERQAIFDRRLQRRPEQPFGHLGSRRTGGVDDGARPDFEDFTVDGVPRPHTHDPAALPYPGLHLDVIGHDGTGRSRSPQDLEHESLGAVGLRVVEERAAGE